MATPARTISERILAIHTASARHLHLVAAESRRDRGFTLIELLVVVIIIGILAAIAIPVYIGVQNNARDAAVKSDLANAQIAYTAYWASGATTAPVVSTTTNDLASFGYRKSADVKLAVIKTGSTSVNFCISTSRDTTPVGDTFKVTHEGAAVKGAC